MRRDNNEIFEFQGSVKRGSHGRGLLIFRNFFFLIIRRWNVLVPGISSYIIIIQSYKVMQNSNPHKILDAKF